MIQNPTTVSDGIGAWQHCPINVLFCTEHSVPYRYGYERYNPSVNNSETPLHFPFGFPCNSFVILPVIPSSFPAHSLLTPMHTTGGNLDRNPPDPRSDDNPCRPRGPRGHSRRLIHFILSTIPPLMLGWCWDDGCGGSGGCDRSSDAVCRRIGVEW